MKRQLPTFLLGVVILALLVWYFLPPSTPQPNGTRVVLPAPTATPTFPSVPSVTSKIPTSESERSHLADDLHSPAAPPRRDLQLVSEILSAFRTNFPREGNPVGTNAEITATLTGQNKLHLALIPPDHPAINQAGELVDRYGTPFFFHAESGTKMTIESAGPDKKRHTPDDEIFTP